MDEKGGRYRDSDRGHTGRVKQGASACIGVWGLGCLIFETLWQGMASSPIHEHGVGFGFDIGICIWIWHLVALDE